MNSHERRSSGLLSAGCALFVFRKCQAFFQNPDKDLNSMASFLHALDSENLGIVSDSYLIMRMSAVVNASGLKQFVRARCRKYRLRRTSVRIMSANGANPNFRD